MASSIAQKFSTAKQVFISSISYFFPLLIALYCNCNCYLSDTYAFPLAVPSNGETAVANGTSSRRSSEVELKDELEVLFVDYGNRDVVRADARDVRPLVPAVTRLPQQAVQLALAGVPFDTQLTASEAVRSFLRTTLVHKLLLAHFHHFDVFHNRWQVFLYAVGDSIYIIIFLFLILYCTLLGTDRHSVFLDSEYL